MKELIAIMTIITSIATTSMPLTDYQLVFKYCDTYYPNYTVCIFTEWNEEVMSNRANTNIVYVQVEESISSGLIDSCNGKYWGYVKGQHYYKTWYNKKVEKGETVKSYYIFNPENNYSDDIVAVIDNQILR